MRPPCHNRPPAADTYIRYGLDSDTGEVIEVVLHKWFEDRCTLWDDRGFGPDTNQSFAQWQGYECGGCRWRRK